MFSGSRNASFFTQNATKLFFQAKCAYKNTIKKFLSFGKNYELTPLQKCKFCNFLNQCFYSQERLIFYLQCSPNTLLKNNLFTKKRRRNSKFFYQNHVLTPLKKCKFCDFFISKFLWSRKTSFLSRKQPNTFSRPNFPKET